MPRDRSRPTGESMLSPQPESLGPSQPEPAPPQPQAEEESGPEMAYLSGRVPRTLRDELRVAAIREGRPVADLLREAVTSYLTEHHTTT